MAEETIVANRLRASNTSFMTFIFTVALALILWFGGRLVVRDELTAGQLAQFIFYLGMLAMPVRMSGEMLNGFSRAMSSGERIFQVLDTQSAVKEKPTAITLPRTTGNVRFENVSFSYDSSVPTVKNIDFEVEPGQVIALLGAPGSGKSTIVHLLPRFYDVDQGRITIDGIDIRDATLPSLRRNIGIVMQDVFLFNDTIRANIAYGGAEAREEDIIRAAQIAQLHDFIQELPQGYDSWVGERGVTLSGGQRQRMAIARTILLDPPILILDDSTSSMDTQTEELIRKALNQLVSGRTTFVIAHRLSTVHNADTILILKDWEIVEQGTHQQLLRQSSLYRDIYELQLRPQEEVMLETTVVAEGGDT